MAPGRQRFTGLVLLIAQLTLFLAIDHEEECCRQSTFAPLPMSRQDQKNDIRRSDNVFTDHSQADKSSSGVKPYSFPKEPQEKKYILILK
jgi:hypothetical protein